VVELAASRSLCALLTHIAVFTAPATVEGKPVTRQ
jgi:hypothetical protein